MSDANWDAIKSSEREKPIRTTMEVWHELGMKSGRKFAIKDIARYLAEQGLNDLSYEDWIDRLNSIFVK